MSELYQTELRKILRKRIRGIMQPTENVLYFKNNIDVRLCPKNGMTTIKMAFLYTDGIEFSNSNFESLRYGTKRHRLDQVKTHGFMDDMPFRKGSTRVAVTRDPLKRFLSACEYIKIENERVDQLTELKDIERASDVDVLPDTLDEIIDGVWNGEIQNSHFFTQTHYHGNRGQYDRIWKMSEFDAFLNWLRVCTGSSKKLSSIRKNRTSGLYFGGVETLTQHQKKGIMRIYEEDYDYGWTED